MKNTSSDDVYFCENCKSLIFFEEPFKETDHYYLFLSKINKKKFYNYFKKDKKRNLLNIEISEKFLLFEKEAFFPLW